MFACRPTRRADTATFHAEIEKIVAEHRLDQHPYVKLVNEGRAARDQLKGYPIQHYEMTVRDSAPISAVAYLKMYEIDQRVAHGSGPRDSQRRRWAFIATRQDIPSCCSSCGKKAWDCRASNW